MISGLKKNKRIEYAVFFLFLVLYGIVMVYHEPWFDEAQSWQIAKCASIREMLFEIPHYEGHPPFWWLLLAVPAKLGVPFELGLKTVGALLTLSCVWLILFRMPYPRIMRLMLPFTYFVFYQYGVIVRPYSILLLSCLLLALAFPIRNEKPYHFMLLLMLLCLSSAYGIVLAGGVALCILYEIVQEKGFKLSIKTVFQDPRTISLCLLLILALGLVAGMLPRKDTWVTSTDGANSFLLCLICAMFTFLGDCTITTSRWFTMDRVLIQNVTIPWNQLFINCIIGILLWSLIIGVSSKRSLKFFLVPYGLLAVFASAVYFCVHHVGIFLSLLLFWLGILFQDENRFEIGKAIIDKIAKTEKDKTLLRNTAKGICTICMIVPVYWSVRAAANDIQLDYSYGRNVASFLNEHGLEHSHILSAWQGGDLLNDQGSMLKTDPMMNTYAIANPVPISAYFDHNICYNLNSGNDSEAYMHYKRADAQENEMALEKWKEVGIPELLLGRPNLYAIYGDEIRYDDYSLVLIMKSNFIWKDQYVVNKIPVYMRNDLLSRHQVEPIVDLSLQYATEGFSITEEMKEAFENGTPIEEILKPYLDVVFGPVD